MFIHIIKSTDTLWGIANLYGVLPGVIMHMNQLPTPDRLLIGQALIIHTDKKYHIIQPGETIFQIAQAYDVPLPKLLQINQLHDSNYIYSGMQIIIPVNKPCIDGNAYTNIIGADAGRLGPEVGNELTYVCPCVYIMKKDGTIELIKGEGIITSAVRANVSPMMCITNFISRDSGSQLAHTILSNEDIQNCLLSNIINTMRAKGYRGLNIDFKNTYPNDRELYNQFLQRTINLLHGQGYYVSTALALQISA